MQKKTTAKLEKDLKCYNRIENYLKDNHDELTDKTLSQSLLTLISEKKLSRAKVAKDSNLNEIYAYQIISGVRKPSRDKLISLCFGLRTTLEETQNLLKRNGYAPLYARSKRDSIIIFAIEHGKSILELNTSLYDCGEKTL